MLLDESKFKREKRIQNLSDEARRIEETIESANLLSREEKEIRLAYAARLRAEVESYRPLCTKSSP